MALASISVPVVEQAPKDCYHQHLCLHRESQLSPASLWGSSRSASGPDPGSFQITASVLGLRVYEILHVPFKSRVSVFYSLLALWSPAGLQSQMSGGSSLAQEPQAAETHVGLEPLTPWEEPLQLWLSSFLWVAYRGMGAFIILYLCLSYSSPCGSFFIS